MKIFVETCSWLVQKREIYPNIAKLKGENDEQPVTNQWTLKQTIFLTGLI